MQNKSTNSHISYLNSRYLNLIDNYKYIKTDTNMHNYLCKIRLFNSNILELIQSLELLNNDIRNKNDIYLTENEQIKIKIMDQEHQLIICD